MKAGKWYPLERLEDDVEDKVSYRWPHKTERMWELRLEGRMGDVLERARAAGKPVVAVAESLPHDRLRANPDYP